MAAAVGAAAKRRALEKVWSCSAEVNVMVGPEWRAWWVGPLGVHVVVCWVGGGVECASRMARVEGVIARKTREEVGTTMAEGYHWEKTP